MAGFRVAERRVVPRAKAAKKTQNAVVLDQIFESFRDNHRSFLGSNDRGGCARRAHTQNDLWLSLNREREGRRSTYHIATSAPAVTKVSSLKVTSMEFHFQNGAAKAEQPKACPNLVAVKINNICDIPPSQFSRLHVRTDKGLY